MARIKTFFLLKMALPGSAYPCPHRHHFFYVASSKGLVCNGCSTARRMCNVWAVSKCTVRAASHLPLSCPTALNFHGKTGLSRTMPTREDTGQPRFRYPYLVPGTELVPLEGVHANSRPTFSYYITSPLSSKPPNH